MNTLSNVQKLILSLVLAFFLAGSASAAITVTLTTVDVNNQSSVSIAFNFTANNGSVLNITNATLWGNFSGAWGSNVSNTTNVIPGNGYVFNVMNIPEGVYVWNVNVTGDDNAVKTFNFSSFNRTLVVDRTKPQFNQAVILNTSFFPQGMGLTRYYTLFGNVSFRIVLNNSFANSTNTEIQSVNVTYNNSYGGNMGASNGTFAGLNKWNTTVNLSSAVTLDGPANLTVNITDYAGNSEVVAISRFTNSFGFETAPLYISNWPAVQVRVFNPKSGKPLNNSNPASYNVTVTISAESFGGGGQGITQSSFTRDFPVDSDGQAFLIVNDSNWQSNPPTLYRIGMITIGSNGNASHMSNSLPPMPLSFIAPPGRPKNGLNIYAAPAETFRLNVTNGTHCTRFMGMIQDSNSGQFVKFFDNVSGLNSTGGVGLPCALVNATVPSNRNYTITIGNPPSNAGQEVPPRTISITTDNLSDSDLTDLSGPALTVQFNTSYTRAAIFGNLTVNDSSTTSLARNNVNFTAAYAYMMAGDFVPPMGVAASWNSSQVNASAGFNFTGLPTGVTYLIVAFGNSSSSGTATQFAGFAKVTLSASTQQNITLRELAGTLRTSTDFQDFVNTSKMRINFIDSNGSAITGDTNAEIVLNFTTIYPGVLIRRSIRSQGGNNVDVVILKNTQLQVRAFAPQYAPVERTFDSSVTNSNSSINITLKTPEFRKPRQDGADQAAISTMVIDMFESNSTCNVPEPDYSCNFANKFSSMRKVGSDVRNGSMGNFSGESFSGGGFDPLDTNMQGNIINMRITDSSTNITTYMMGLDMASAGQPSMEMDNTRLEKRTGTTGKQQELRRFGSAVPSSMIQVGIWVGTPYNETEVNESQPMNASIPYLYDDDGILVWNFTINTSQQIPQHYADYVSWFTTSKVGNASMLANITCQDTFNASDSAQKCFRNTTTNLVWLEIPHFSTIAVSVDGSTVSSPSSSSSSTTTGNSGGFGTFGTSQAYTTITATPTASATTAPTASAGATAAPTPSPTAPLANAKQITQSSNAIASASNLIASAKASGRDTTEAERLMQLARQYQAQGDYAKASSYAEQAKRLLEATSGSATPAATAATTQASAASSGVDLKLAIGAIAIVLLAYAGYALMNKPPVAKK